MVWNYNTMFIHDRVFPDVEGVEDWKSMSTPKMCCLPPLKEDFEQNFHRTHYQVGDWYGDPPYKHVVEYGWEADSIV